jgi:pyruvate dehydrogenase E1 component alpha subunit
VTQLSKRAESYGIVGVTIDGNDVIAVYNAVREAVIRARQHEGATLIEALTYRWHGHYEGDPQVYKPEGELEQWQAHDPIERMGAALMDNNLIDAEGITELRTEVLSQLDAAVEFTRSSPFPAPEAALMDVFADLHDGKVF